MRKKEHSLVLYLSFQLIVQHLDFRLSCMHGETEGSAHFSKISPLTTTTHINVHICTSKLFALCALQKYRLYLKRLSAVASQQACIVAALGGSDPFMRMGAFEGLQGYQAFTSSVPLSSFSPQGLLNRNNPTSFGIQGMSASRPIQIATGNSTISHSIGDANKYHLSFAGTSNRQGNLVQGLATSVGHAQVQQKWIQEETHDLSTIISGNGLVNGVPGTLRSATSGPLLQQDLVESRQAKIVIQPSSSVNSQRLECTAGVSSSLMDSHVSQQSGLSLSAFSASALPMNGSFGSTNVAKLGATSSGGTNICPSNDLRIARDNEVGGDTSLGSVILLPPDTAQNQKYLNFGGGSSLSHSAGGGNTDSVLDSKLVWSSLPTSQPPSTHHPLSQRPNSGTLGVKMIEQTSAGASTAAPQTKFDMFTSGDILTAKNTLDSGFPRLNSELSSSSCSFDGLLNSIIKVVRGILLCLPAILRRVRPLTEGAPANLFSHFI
jgi:two-component response regulator (ARR-B family)